MNTDNDHIGTKMVDMFFDTLAKTSLYWAAVYNRHATVDEAKEALKIYLRSVNSFTAFCFQCDGISHYPHLPAPPVLRIEAKQPRIIQRYVANKSIRHGKVISKTILNDGRTLMGVR